MALSNIASLLEQRRSALLEYCIGHATRADYSIVETSADLLELLRLDPLDTYAVQSSWVAEKTSCVQQIMHAVFSGQEPGFAGYEFAPQDLAQWSLYSNYPDWAAVQLIALYPENYISPFVRQRKSSLFKNLENDLNQARLTTDSVQVAMRNYLQAFEQTCDLDVISCYMHGDRPYRADYYFVGRQRMPPFQYFWRKAEIELTPTCVAVNPAAWSEWQAVEIQPANRVIEMRPVFWNGRLCLVWAEWRDEVKGSTDQSLPHKLDVNLAFMTQNGQWSAPLSLYSAEVDESHAEAFRLIAVVRTDTLDPKGKLGVFISGGKTPETDTSTVKTSRVAEPLKVPMIYDVLMRLDHNDAGEWLEDAQGRFTTPETVQHSLGSQVSMTSEAKPHGSISSYLELNAVALRENDNDVLTVNGYCRPTGLPEGVDPVFKLTLVNPTGGDAPPLVSPYSQAGGWKTGSMRFIRSKGSWPQPTRFTFGTDLPEYGSREFQLTIVDLASFEAPVLLKNAGDAAQFLSFNLPDPYLKCTRLNSLFGPELVQRSNISVDAVLDWDTQFLAEPPPTGQVFEEFNGAFDGANGLFFWELFFHLPHLVATRLRDEERFADAQSWLQYVFNPQASEGSAKTAPKVAYWRCRPLANEAGNAGCESLAPIDPDAIGYSAPKHFKILMFCDYVKNLMAWGDWYYRQLTRDSLVAAKLCYVQAGSLMGNAPLARAVTRWQTDSVENLLAMSCTRSALEQFEQTLDFSLADVPAGSDAAPMLGLLACEPFKAPLNQPLLDLYAAPEQRLYTLRNNMTIDGKPLDIPLFSPPTDPSQLLADLAAGGVGGPRPMGGRPVVNAFRWRVTYEVALRAVQALQDWGSQVLNLLERRDRALQEELQQSHLVELGSYAQTVQEQSIAQLEANVTALAQSRAVAQQRAQAYAQRYDDNVSAVEYQVMASLKLSKVSALQAKVLKVTAGVTAALPKIIGMSNGGMKPENAIEAVSFGLEVASSLLQIDADTQATTEGYRRRRNEWGLQRDQALAEVEAIDAQIEAPQHAVAAARTSLAQTLRANDQALAVYNFLKKRATNAELFGWMLGQMKALYYQAYDAVISLCLSAQASMNAETGDYDAQRPLPRMWLDQFHGMAAGEHLRWFLLSLEREYVQRYERRLELVKTVSLRKLFEDKVDPQADFDGWAAALQQLRTTGVLEFQLSQLLFDRDYPGHYCRQISSVEIDLPILTGPFEDVRATLLQIGSMTAIRPTTQSVQYLYKPEGQAPLDVLFNLRSAQQIALSVGIADNGVTTMKPDEGLLHSYEKTGCVSCWQLSFPRAGKEPQVSMLQSLNDVIVRIRYTAKAGEPTFARKVEDLVTEAEEARENAKTQGADSHA
ncbi:insecticidal toxin complex protein TcaB2 [Pseudomonas baetica]|uniref:Tc toxin subunit A-related protein n=1 Tax=Pseudomonas baetica TaxID=674054 RepID=UPI001C8C9BA0|nr:neuraminidase-like domain-containing protein [Pseudomonas baetica]MBX9406102.1 insecticidal toxin complex protein TcaB2 [Pseudomonas baetica]